MFWKNFLNRKSSFDIFLIGSAKLDRLKAEGRYSCYRNTRATLRKLSAFMQNNPLPAGKVTPELMKAFAAYLEDELGNGHNTIVENLRIVSQLLDEAEVTPNPCRVLGLTREQGIRPFLTEDELDRLMSLRLRRKSLAATARDMFYVECRTGLRISDLLQIRRSCFDGKYIRLRMQKTRRIVSVPASKGVRQILERYSARTGGDRFIFPFLNSLPEGASRFETSRAMVSATSRINVQIKRLARQAGIEKKVSTHVARHTFATQLLSKGASVYEVKELLGHQDIRVTQVYTHLMEDRKEALVELLE